MSDSYGFLSDKPRRENFADEASFYTAQQHWLAMQRRQPDYQQTDANNESYRQFQEKLAEIQAKRAEKRAKQRQERYDRYWRDPEHACEINRKSYRKHRPKRLAYKRAWRHANSDYAKARDKQYNAEHREQRHTRNQQSWQNIISDPFAHGYYNATKRMYRAERRATDPVYAWKENKRNLNWQKNKRATDPVWRQKANARNREYYVTNHEKLLAQKQEHYRSHRDEELARDRAWRAKHRDEVNARRRDKRATDVEYAERQREHSRASRARKKAEKLAQQQREDNAA